ncbi:MAG: hypothetical protein ACI9LM_001687 [Alteromonadaceae bacterium]|jgi:hypothetical protein
MDKKQAKRTVELFFPYLSHVNNIAQKEQPWHSMPLYLYIIYYTRGH